MRKALKTMEYNETDKQTENTQSQAIQPDLYAPIIQKIKYWQDYTGTGDEYRREHDLDCILTGGNLNADTIFSLWLPLRYTLNAYKCEQWEEWKAYEAKKLKAQKRGLKDCSAFLKDLTENIHIFLPPKHLTKLLSELFQLGQQRCNVMILPEGCRCWNKQRGCNPYWDYLPHFLYDLMNTDDSISLSKLQSWLKQEHLEMFFEGSLTKDHLKDLAGTGSVCRHAPKTINLEQLLLNYIDILKKRKHDYE